MGDRPVFDEYGLLDGPGSDSVWEQLCGQVEAEFHLVGWDQPARMFAVLSADETLQRRGAASVEDSRATLEVLLEMTGALDEPNFGIATGDRVMDLVDLGADADPLELVWGKVVAPTTPAVLMIWEADGWLGPATQRRTHAPNRTRFVSLAMRSGRQVTVARTRGEEPVTVPDSWYLGRPGLALRRVVGAPCPPAPLRVQDWLGRITLGHAAAGLLALDGTWTPDPAQMLPESMARQVAEADPEELPKVQEALARRVMTSALALVVTLIFGNLTTRTDAAGAALRTQLRQAVMTARNGTPRDLVELASIAGERTWAEVLADESVTGVLSSQVVQHRHWCDENLLAWTAWESHPSQESTLSALLAATNETIFAEVTCLLAAAGWLVQE